MFKTGTKTHRSLRNIAEEKNGAAGFGEDPAYFAQGGVPTHGGQPGAPPISPQHYGDNAEGARLSPNALSPSKHASPISGFKDNPAAYGRMPPAKKE